MPSAASPAARRSFAPRLALVLALALLAWSGAVARGGLALDDAEILAAPFVRAAAGWEALREDYWAHRGPAGHWRPAALASLRLEQQLHGARPALLHASNVALHLAVVTLAAFLLRNAACALPWLGLALFALHPALADAVAWISGRSSMLCALGGLAGASLVALELRREEPRGAALAAAAALALLLALAGKEEGLVFAPLVVLLGAARAPRSASWCAAGALVGLVAAGCLRADALGSPWPSAPHAPLAERALPARLEAGGLVVLEGLRLAAAPLPHAPLARAPELVDSLSSTDRLLRALAGLGFVLVLSALGLLGLARARRPRVRERGWRAPRAASALLVGCASLPYLQLVPAGELFAPRFLYLPLLLAVPLLDAILRALRLPRAALVLGACVLLALAWTQSGVYASRRAWCEAVLAAAPSDARVWNDLGLGLEEEGRGREAELAWRRALALDPSYGRPWSNLARLLEAEGERAAALDALERATALGPANPLAWHNLGALLLGSRRPAEAAEAFERATRLAPGHAPSWRALARARAALGNEAGARGALQRALALDPEDSAALSLERELRAPSPR